MCIYSLLCLREGEAEGEGTEFRGAGMGHLRIGSSTMLLLSISSTMYSTLRHQRRREENRGYDKQRRHSPKEVWRRMVRRRMGEEKHFRGILQDQYNSRSISMVNSLSCIQFAHFHKPQNHFCQQSSLSCSWKQKGVTGESKREERRENRFRFGDAKQYECQCVSKNYESWHLAQ